MDRENKIIKEEVDSYEEQVENLNQENEEKDEELKQVIIIFIFLVKRRM